MSLFIYKLTNELNCSLNFIPINNTIVDLYIAHDILHLPASSVGRSAIYALSVDITGLIISWNIRIYVPKTSFFSPESAVFSRLLVTISFPYWFSKMNNVKN